MKIKLSSIMVENQATALAFYTDVLFSTSIHGEETHLAQRDLEFSDHSGKRRKVSELQRARSTGVTGGSLLDLDSQLNDCT